VTKFILFYLIRTYQKIAPERIRKACRYHPTCSEYAIAAIDKYGSYKGGDTNG